jgi:hypothetical protein
MFPLAAPAAAEPSVVRIDRDQAGFRLVRNGRPYVIKGAGGDGSMKLLVEKGGNSVRTWGADRAGAILDEAERLGITVTVGIWLGHERHGFDYSDGEQVAKQYEAARATILRFKDHPALLMWGIGNEMEGEEKGNKGAIWSAVNNIAATAKALDPNHPTMTVIAELGSEKVKSIHRLCPAIDIVGINSYGGASTLPKRYREAGGKKPYVLSEFGPRGQWESEKTQWGAAIEETSTAKAERYRVAYEKAVAGSGGLCLGSYAFLWGHKQEATATWFSLFLADGSRTGAVDVLTEMWTGKRPANGCPAIRRLTIEGRDRVAPGARLVATLDAADPDRDPLTVRWVLQKEGAYGSGGDAEAEPPSIPAAVAKSTDGRAELIMPRDGGPYRLFAYVHDDHGGVATANLPLFVEGAMVKGGGAPAAKLPLVIYAEGDQKSFYAPSGWMGNARAITVDPMCPDRPHSGKTSMAIDYASASGWGGVVWQHPDHDWGEAPGGLSMAGAKTLSFWARGAEGGEVVSFAYGVLGPDKKYPDSSGARLDRVTLDREWKRFTIPLAGKDLSRIKTPFSWTAAAEGKPVRFYIDDVRFE